MAMTVIGTFLRRDARTVAEDVRRIGVLWSGDHLFEGTVETLEILRNKGEHVLPNSGLALTIRPGKQVVFVTNNSTKSRAEYIKKLTSMGIPAKVVRPPLSPLEPPAEDECPGRSLRLLLQRRSLHLPHPAPPHLQKNRLRSRRKRHRNRTRQRKRPPHRRHRPFSPTRDRTERLRSNRLRRIPRPIRWCRAMWIRLPY